MEACKFVKEAFTHYKPIAGTNEGKTWIENEKMGTVPESFRDVKKSGVYKPIYSGYRKPQILG